MVCLSAQRRGATTKEHTCMASRGAHGKTHKRARDRERHARLAARRTRHQQQPPLAHASSLAGRRKLGAHQRRVPSERDPTTQEIHQQGGAVTLTPPRYPQQSTHTHQHARARHLRPQISPLYDGQRRMSSGWGDVTQQSPVPHLHTHTQTDRQHTCALRSERKMKFKR